MSGLCTWCGNPFEPRNNGGKQQRFCSTPCRRNFESACRVPETIDDMRAYFADRIEAVQDRMQGSNTDMWEAYWADARPKGET